MSFLIHLLILSLLPCLSTSSDSQYRIIRNAAIDPSIKVDHTLTARTCDDCLCHASTNSDKVNSFTCTQNETNSICQFYNSMPTRDQVEPFINDTSIYLMKNETFYDNCCNTPFLISRIEKQSAKENKKYGGLRSLIAGDNDTLVTNTAKSVLKFNKSTLEFISAENCNSLGTDLLSIRYLDNRYYLGTENSIKVYDETLTTSIYSIPIIAPVTAIRFIDETYMIVAASTKSILIYEKDASGNFTNCTSHLKLNDGQQSHAIGIVNGSAFYVGWDANVNIILVTKNENNLWVNSTVDTINYYDKTSDIFVDDECKRIWVIEANKNRIFIYNQNEINPYIFTLPGNIELFNILIVDYPNYTFVVSTKTGLFRIQPDVNCRP